MKDSNQDKAEKSVPTELESIVDAEKSSSEDAGHVAAISALKEFGRGRTLPSGVTVRDLIEEGRRFSPTA